MASVQVNITIQTKTIVATQTTGYTTFSVNKVYNAFEVFALANDFTLTEEYLIKTQLKELLS